MDLEKIINLIVNDLQLNAMPYENYVYEPKSTHQIIRKHLTEQLNLCEVGVTFKEKYTPEFEEWLNRFFDYKPKTYEYQSKNNKHHFMIKDLVRKYEKAMITSALN